VTQPTTTAIASPPGSAGARPARPRPPLTPWLALAAVAAITVWASLASTGIGVDLAELVRNGRNATRVLSQLVDPHWSFWRAPLGPLLETLEMAVVATAIGALIALPLIFLASRITNPFRPAVVIVRAILSVLRSVPDLLFASLFVTIIGVGSLSGILALTLFTIGIIVKLTSEVVDAIDTGPIEAARSSGATWPATDRAAVFPQILPSFAATTLYVFELNIRASAVLGLVGAGGLGDLINVVRKFYRYQDLSMIIIEVLVVIIVLEAASQALRRRLA
jgi:phosphonate transport system permease protein